MNIKRVGKKWAEKARASVHKLKVLSLHDAQAECTGCGWHYLATGLRTFKEIEHQWELSHTRKLEVNQNGNSCRS